MAYLGFIDEACIVPELKATDKRGVITELVETLHARGLVRTEAREPLVEAILAREEVGSTGIGRGVAIPHAKATPLVDKLVGAFGRAPAGVEFGAIDGEPVHLIFLLVSPESADPSEHIAVMRRLAKLGRSELFCRFLLEATTVAEIASTLEESESLAER